MSNLLLLLGQVSQNFQQSFPCMGHHAEKDSFVKHLISFFFFFLISFFKVLLLEAGSVLCRIIDLYRNISIYSKMKQISFG